MSQSEFRCLARRAHSDVRNATPRPARYLLAAALLVFASCDKNPVVIASSDVRSPDGEWLATALTDQYSGPGNAGLYEIVSLHRTAGLKDTTQVLLLDVGGKAPPIAIKMVWLTNSHLEIEYQEPAKVEFQVVRSAGVDISLRDSVISR